MKSAGQLQFTSPERVDYNPMLGYTEPAVRIDPHMHEIDNTQQPDLQRVADIIRDRSGFPREPK